jgi:C4-dicarboxylate-specific signal transduction histidine kinase
MDYTGLPLEDLDTRGGTRLANAIQAVVHPDHRPAVAASLGHSFATGEPFRLKYRMRRADGAYRWIEGRAHPLRDSAGQIVQWYGVCLDIDDETRMQEALRAAHDKLARASQAASLAELSASIAHEVNQPLAAIVTNSAACQRWLSAAPPNIERAGVPLERIIRDANSAAEVVSRIRALFKQTGQARAAADLNEVIAEACQLMAGEMAKNNISIETDLQSDLPQILVDRVQMQQVVVNLVRNGIDAMASVAGGPRSLQIRSCRCAANLLCVEVRDQGGGIEEPERVFEPFYSTKDQGMGMGLAICRSIIESHEGRIWAARNQPRGATFAFTLPIEPDASR